MKYKVHKLYVNLKEGTTMLENYLNDLGGEVISVFPTVKPVFMFYGAKVVAVVIVEKVKK